MKPVNLFLRFSRDLYVLYMWIKPHYSDDSIFGKLRRWIAYEVISPVRLQFRQWGEQKFLYVRHHGNAGTEMRNHLFLQLRLYVEGYLANTAHRKVEVAPKTMPSNTHMRQLYGLFHLQKLGRTQKQKRAYEELARIYEWLIYDYPNWNNPYWKEAPTPTLPEDTSEGILSAMSEEEKGKWNEMTDKAKRLDRIIATRVEDRARRLYELKDMLLYD